MPPTSLLLLRFTITVQVVVAAWFVFSPDFLPTPFVQAEIQNDRPLYAVIDSIIVPLNYFQTALCLALWFPTKIVSWLFSVTVLSVALLGSFAGPAVLSAIDAFLSYFQALAAGAMIATLFSNGYFNFTSRNSAANG